MRLIRWLVTLSALSAVGALVGATTDPPRQSPNALEDAHPLIRVVLEGLWTGTAWASHHSIPLAFLLAVASVPFLIAKAAARFSRCLVKDPQRLFSPAQRRSISELADGRCEMEGVFFTRCRRPGEAGDHWFPHSKGGATDMANLVWACGRCNSRKSDKIPTWWETIRLDIRRRKYFPEGMATRPGSKYGQFALR